MSTPVRTLLAPVAGVAVGAVGIALGLGGESAEPSSLRLDAGFVPRHRHGGPAVNLVRAGHVEISDDAGARRHGRGESFVEPGGRVHTITVLDDAVIDVVRILPAAAAATTEVPDPAR